MKPGDKVVCIDGNFCPSHVSRCSSLPIKNLVYVVDKSETWKGKLGVSLIGIKMNLCKIAGVPYLFKSERFRLLEQMKLESSQHKNTLATANQVAG
jgi:hypothetical protein